MSWKKNLYYRWINWYGYKTKRKVVGFESDDWGSIRMPSKYAYEQLEQKGIRVGSCPYSRFDSLERSVDVENLMEVLSAFRDSHGRTAKMTMNFLTANPDFAKIKDDNFESYSFIDLQSSYEKYADSKCLSTLKEGLDQKIFSAQFHGREHMNTTEWLRLLKENEAIRLAFDYDCFALSFKNHPSIKVPYLAALSATNGHEAIAHGVIDEGIELFKKTFGHSPESFIAQVYIWNELNEEHLSKVGVKSIQGLYKRQGENGKTFLRSRDAVNRFGQAQLVRNCFFEPSTSEKHDWVSECLNEIRIAFNSRRPAIICTHRLNFMGALREENRTRNLRLLKELILQIKKNWNDVEFLDSAELAENILTHGKQDH